MRGDTLHMPLEAAPMANRQESLKNAKCDKHSR
jgi:hypothetical protein